MVETIFHNSHYYFRYKSPLRCHACKNIIIEDEKIEITYNGRNVFCSKCNSKKILVYPIRLIHTYIHDKNLGFSKQKNIIVIKRWLNIS